MADPTIIIHGKNPQINRRTASTIIAEKSHHEHDVPKALDSNDPPPPKKVTHAVAENILKARSAKGLTRKQVGQQLAMSESLITSFENAETVINTTNSKKFVTYCQFLGVKR